MNINPIRRSPIKRKPRQSKITKSGRVRMDAKQVAALRYYVMDRSGGRCENSTHGKRCATRISWHTFHMHHMIHRSQGGSDSKENCVALCMDCHYGHHEGLWQIELHPEWAP